MILDRLWSKKSQVDREWRVWSVVMMTCLFLSVWVEDTLQ